jgi:hypothetical protein
MPICLLSRSTYSRSGALPKLGLLVALVAVLAGCGSSKSSSSQPEVKILYWVAHVRTPAGKTLLTPRLASGATFTVCKNEPTEVHTAVSASKKLPKVITRFSGAANFSQTGLDAGPNDLFVRDANKGLISDGRYVLSVTSGGRKLASGYIDVKHRPGCPAPPPVTTSNNGVPSFLR